MRQMNMLMCIKGIMEFNDKDSIAVIYSICQNEK